MARVTTSRCSTRAAIRGTRTTSTPGRHGGSRATRRRPARAPTRTGILAQPNNQGQPWQCVIKAPGFSPGVIGDGIAAAIGNCANINTNSCNQYACTNKNFYDPANPDQWALNGPNAGTKRVVFLFIVPYGAYKNTGPQDGLPVLNFAAFYITGWHGNDGNAGQNPCEGDPRPAGARPAGRVRGARLDHGLLRRLHPARRARRPERRLRVGSTPSVCPCTRSLVTADKEPSAPN